MLLGADHQNGIADQKTGTHDSTKPVNQRIVVVIEMYGMDRRRSGHTAASRLPVALQLQRR
jgi:hypothetical protein